MQKAPSRLTVDFSHESVTYRILRNAFGEESRFELSEKRLMYFAFIVLKSEMSGTSRHDSPRIANRY